MREVCLVGCMCFQRPFRIGGISSQLNHTAADGYQPNRYLQILTQYKHASGLLSTVPIPLLFFGSACVFEQAIRPSYNYHQDHKWENETLLLELIGGMFFLSFHYLHDLGNKVTTAVVSIARASEIVVSMVLAVGKTVVTSKVFIVSELDCSMVLTVGNQVVEFVAAGHRKPAHRIHHLSRSVSFHAFLFDNSTASITEILTQCP
jgi:hypothetical protein